VVSLHEAIVTQGDSYPHWEHVRSLKHDGEHWGSASALAVGLSGRVYSGNQDGTIRAWSGYTGEHLQTLDLIEPERSKRWHTDIKALTVGLDGKIYSCSSNFNVEVWSGDDGTHIQTLEGHVGYACALAVGVDGRVYSGSSDTTIRVWLGEVGANQQTLVGHDSCVNALAVSLDGSLYSGSEDCRIRVWSGDDGAHISSDSGRRIQCTVSSYRSHHRCREQAVLGAQGRRDSGVVMCRQLAPAHVAMATRWIRVSVCQIAPCRVRWCVVFQFEARRPYNRGDVRRLFGGCPVLPTRIVGSRFLIW
jgi:WD40 repeat protein